MTVEARLNAATPSRAEKAVPTNKPTLAETNRVLVKLRPSTALRAAAPLRGGSTLVVDLSIPDVKYRIVKNIENKERQDRTAAFVRDATADPLRALFLAPDRREPFAALHSLADEGL